MPLTCFVMQLDHRHLSNSGLPIDTGLMKGYEVTHVVLARRAEISCGLSAHPNITIRRLDMPSIAIIRKSLVGNIENNSSHSIYAPGFDSTRSA